MLKDFEPPEFTPPTHAETVRDLMDRGDFTPVGLIMRSDLSDEGWLHLGATLLKIQGATPWWWADWWLAQGSRLLPDDWRGPAQHTLDNQATAARAFPISRRRETVSLAHHGEVAHLPETEQDEMLDWCTATRASLHALRAEKQRRAAAKLPPPLPPLRIEPPPSSPAWVEPPESVSPSVIQPPEPPVKPLPPTDDIAIPVMLYVPPELHAWLTEGAADEGMQFDAWGVELWWRAKDAAK
jgi:hypothetical protein